MQLLLNFEHNMLAYKNYKIYTEYKTLYVSQTIFARDLKIWNSKAFT